MVHAIETSQLGKRYRQAWAVRDLDLQLPEGAVFGFLGPNGAGKTTTMRMLLGLITPSQGGGTILGHDIRSDREPIVRQVGAIVESLLVEAELFPLVQAVAERMGVRVQQVGPRAATMTLTPERAPELTAALVRAGANVWQITPQRSTLEQRFLQLTGAPDNTNTNMNQRTPQKENNHDFVVAR